MANKFDRIIRENFQGLTMSLLRRMMNIAHAEVVVLPGRMQRTLEREMDALLQAHSPELGKHLINVEWQTSNDHTMHYRMLLYHALAAMAYKLPVRGIVIYIGAKKMNMPVLVDHPNLRYQYEQVDLVEMDPEIFLQSDIPEEILLAVLAGQATQQEKRRIIQKILIKLRWLLKDEQELNKRIAQLEIFGELRNVQQIIVEEEHTMAITYNLKNDIRYNQGLEEGTKMGLQTGREEGEQKATAERNAAFAHYLLTHTDHSDEEIALLVNVPLDFVKGLKNKAVR